MSSCLIALVGLGLLDSSNPPASASCGAEITGTNHRTSLNSTQSSPPPTLVHGARIPVEQDSSPAVSSLTYFLVMSLPEKKNASISCLSLGDTQLPFFSYTKCRKLAQISPSRCCLLSFFAHFRQSPWQLFSWLSSLSYFRNRQGKEVIGVSRKEIATRTVPTLFNTVAAGAEILGTTMQLHF